MPHPWILTPPIRRGLVNWPEATPAQAAPPPNAVTLAGYPLFQPVAAALAAANAAQSPEGWERVKETTYNWLIDTYSGTYPDLAAAAAVEQLNALEPGNADFAEANKAALSKAVQYWSEMGITQAALGPIIDACNNIGNIGQPTDTAKKELIDAIEISLMDAASRAPADQRSKAITDRAASIQIAGPQDLAFRHAVDEANRELQINRPAQAVAKAYADAYAAGGPAAAAPAAAAALRTATENSRNAYYAGQIIQASQAIIDEIARYMGSVANHKRPLGLIALPSTDGEKAFFQIYSDLSRSVEMAGIPTVSPGSVSLLLSPGGRDAAGLVASSLVKYAPGTRAQRQGGKDTRALPAPEILLYREAAIKAIGDGVALTLAAAAALMRQGDSGPARAFVEGVAAGIRGEGPHAGLAPMTETALTDLAKATEDLSTIRATWGPFMTGSQLANAVNGYLAAHPDVKQKTEALPPVIAQYGDQIVAVLAAWNSYRAELDGISGHLAAGSEALTGTNAYALFALSQSTKLNSAIAAALDPPLPRTVNGGSVAEALRAFMASPAWGPPKAFRTFANNLGKLGNALAKARSLPPKYPEKVFTTLAFIGLVFDTHTTLMRGGFPASTLQEFLGSLYTGLGFIRFPGEVISGLAKEEIFQIWLRDHPILGPAFELDDTGKSPVLSLKLPGGGRFGLSTLAEDLRFKILIASSFFNVEALFNFGEAIKAWEERDRLGAGLYAALALGNLSTGAKPFTEMLFGRVASEASGSFGSGMGSAAAVALLGYQGVKYIEAIAAYEADSSRFLQQGLGLKPDLAHALSVPRGRNDGPLASAALRAYAEAYNIPLTELLLRLDRAPIGAAIQFIDTAADVPQQFDGTYAKSSWYDSPSKVGFRPLEPVVNGDPWARLERYPANSLRQLYYWADYLGLDVLGPSAAGEAAAPVPAP
jgi:hypothetical protein